jgi:hypothetical protein
MLKALLILTAISATLCLTGVASARSHNVAVPQTLLSLYRQSDVILVGRFDKTVEGGVIAEKREHSVVKIQKYFDITSSLKGENIKLFVLEDSVYRFHAPADGGSADASDKRDFEDFDIADSDDGLRSGNSVLLFLRKKAGGEGYELTDRADGIKKMSDEDLAVYAKRIGELNYIFDTPNVDQTEVVQWLIRCAAEPATRWEGAFELLQASERLAWQQKQGPNCVGVLCQNDNDLRNAGNQADPADLARLLTDNQRSQLLDVLFSNGGDKVSVRGDQELLQLAQQWGDKRLACYLIDKLRDGSKDAFENAQVITMIAKTFRDPQIARFIEKYNSASAVKTDTENGASGPSKRNETRDSIRTTIINRCQAVVSDVTAVRSTDN